MKFESACGFCGMPWTGGFGYQSECRSIDEKFCGRSCFQAWKNGMTFAPTEIIAIENSLKPVGKYVAQAGIMNKTFADCSKEEILGLFANIIKTYKKEFADYLELNDEVPF